VVIPGTIFSTPVPGAPRAATGPVARNNFDPSLIRPPSPAPSAPRGAAGPVATNNFDPSTIRAQSPAGKVRKPERKIAEIKTPQETVFLNDTQNTVYQGVDWNTLTPEESALANGLKIGDIGLPKDRGYSYFKLYVKIDDTQVDIPPGQLTVACRILCADAQGSLAVAQTADTIEVEQRGVHQVVLCNSPGTGDIRRRNDGDGYPRNAYVEFRINGKIFRQVLLSNYGPTGWWTMEKLVPERF
jgi:hypothetical protein